LGTPSENLFHTMPQSLIKLSEITVLELEFVSWKFLN